MRFEPDQPVASFPRAVGLFSLTSTEPVKHDQGTHQHCSITIVASPSSIRAASSIFKLIHCQQTGEPMEATARPGGVPAPDLARAGERHS